MKIPKLLFLLLLILIGACSTENEPEISESANEPVINLTIEVQEDGGVIFKGEHDENNTESAGFYYSAQENFNSASAQFTPADPVNHFAARVDNGLIYNQEYFVRAQILTGNGQNIESMEKSFVSMGSKAPVITEVNNSHLKDTVWIRGANFNSSSYSSTQVFFEDERAHIISSNDSLIKCLVPLGFRTYEPKIYVKVFEKQTVYEDFKLHTPEVFGSSHSEFGLGDTITLYGDHFDIDIDRTQLLSHGSPLEVLATYRDSLNFVLPLNAANSNIELKLMAQKQEVNVDFIGKYTKPRIEKIEGSVKTYDTIILSGVNFSPLKEANEVFFDGLPARILSASRNELEVLTPIGPYEDALPEVIYKIMDYSIQPDEQIVFQDHWLFKAETEYEFYGNTDQHYTYDGKLYLVQKNYGEYELSFLEFDPSTLQFDNFQIILPQTHLADYPFQVVQDKLTEKVYFLFNSDTNNFYEFNPSTKEFHSLKNYPAITSNYPEVFINGNQLFVTGGWVANSDHTNTTYDDLSELWAYEIGKNNWTQKTVNPARGSHSGDVLFQNGYDVYLSYGINTTGGVSFWKYSASSDNWVDLNSHYSAKFGKAFFMHNNKGYAYFADPVNATPSNLAYKYNLNSNTWESIQPLNNRYYTYFNFPRNYAAFKINGKIFIAIYDYPKLKFFEADLDKI